MQRRTLLQYIGATTIGLGLGALPRRASASSVIMLGTLAPKSSLWGKTFTLWSNAVVEKSGGALELQVFYNGQKGGEGAMVSKLKSGKLHGAVLTGVGLGKIYAPILALQMPGLFSSWAKLDAARTACKAEFEKGCTDAGFHLSGWGDVGQVRSMSKGFAVTLPSDLKGKKPGYDRDNPITPAVYSAIGGVSGVPLNVPEVLPSLNTGAINSVAAPSLVAEVLQWSGKLDHITIDPIAMAIGGVVFSTQSLDALPADLRTILIDTCTIATQGLQARVRSEDDAAFSRLKSKMTVTILNRANKFKWETIFAQTRQKLAQGTFSPDLVAKLESFS